MREAEFSSHAVWTALTAAENALQRDDHNEFSTSLSKLIDYFRWILESSDAAFVTPQELEALANELRNSASALATNPISQKVFNQILQFLTPALAKFPYPRLKRIFRSEVNDIVSQIEDDSNSLREKISQLQGVANDSISMAQESRGVSEKVLDEVRRAKAESSSLIGQLEATNSAKMAEVISDLRGEFSEEKNSRSERFQEELNSTKEELGELKSQASAISAMIATELNEVRAKQDQELLEVKAAAEKKYEDIDRLFQEAGQTVLAGGFAEASIGEKTRYENDAWYAKLSFALAAIVLGVLAASDLWRGAFTWQEAILKLPISVVLAAPGLYFAGLASKHRREANRLRSLGLRIGAFDAFVRSAQDTEATDLRATIAPHFFSEGEGKVGDESNELVSDHFLDAIGKVADKLPKIGK